MARAASLTGTPFGIDNFCRCVRGISPRNVFAQRRTCPRPWSCMAGRSSKAKAQPQHHCHLERLQRVIVRSVARLRNPKIEESNGRSVVQKRRRISRRKFYGCSAVRPSSLCLTVIRRCQVLSQRLIKISHQQSRFSFGFCHFLVSVVFFLDDKKQTNTPPWAQRKAKRRSESAGRIAWTMTWIKL